MLQDYIDELLRTLVELGISDTAQYAEDFSARYNAMIETGKSEFESIMALGDPVQNAYAIAGVDYTATDRIANHLLDTAKPDAKAEQIKPMSTGEKIFYIIMLAVTVCLDIAYLFITALTGIISFAYLGLAWKKFDGATSTLVFGLAIVGVIIFAIFAFIAAWIIKRTYRFGKDKLFIKKETTTNTEIK